MPVSWPVIDAMLVAHADDVRAAVQSARAEASAAPVAESSPDAVVETARRLLRRAAQLKAPPDHIECDETRAKMAK